jgi:hypothetical protein
VLPGPLLDADDQVHVVTLDQRWDGATEVPVRHVWHDDTGWQSEFIALAPPAPGASASIGSDGSIQVVWRLKDEDGFAYATNASGSFVVEEVRPAAGGAIELVSPLAIGSGDPAILVAERYGPPRLWFVSRASGAWEAELVPDVAEIPDEGGNLLAYGGVFGWIYTLRNGLGYDLWLRERSAGEWSAAQQLASTTTVPPLATGAAVSPDGSRIAVALPSYETPTRLVVRSGDVTTVTELLPSSGRPQVGFTAAGKLWLVDGLIQSPDYSFKSDIAYAHYEDP